MSHPAALIGLTVAEVMRARGITFRLDVTGLRAWCAKNGKPMPSREDLHDARRQFKKRFLRRKVDPKRGGRPRGSRKPPSPPLELTAERLRVCIECKTFARDLHEEFRDYGGLMAARPIAARAILQFVGNTPANAKRVHTFIRRPKSEHLVRLLVKLRLGIGERPARDLLRRLP